MTEKQTTELLTSLNTIAGYLATVIETQQQLIEESKAAAQEEPPTYEEPIEEKLYRKAVYEDFVNIHGQEKVDKWRKEIEETSDDKLKK